MSDTEKRKKKKDIIAGRDFYVDLEKESNSPYGVTQEYDRRNYEDHRALENFKDQQFSNKAGKPLKTARTPDGQLVYRKRADAEKRVGAEKASMRSADTDHIDPVKNIHNRHKHNPFLTDKDIKEVANRVDNLGLKTAHDNRSKQATSEIQEGLQNKNINQVATGAAKQAMTDALLAGRAIQHVGETFKAGASDALEHSAIPLLIAGTKDLVKVANGEMTFKEAVEDVGTIGVSIAVSGGGMRVASYALSGAIEQSSNELLKVVAKTNQVGTVIIAATIIAKATSKYISGEIDGEGFLEEITNEGLTMIAGIVGGTLGGPLGTIIASTACSMLLSSIEQMKSNIKAIDDSQREYIRRLDIIVNRATNELHLLRDNLKQELEQEKLQWATAMDQGFELIFTGAMKNDLAVVSSGLDSIMKMFDSEVAFKNTEDVRLFMNQNNRVFSL